MTYQSLLQALSEGLRRYLHHAREYRWQYLYEPQDTIAPDEVRGWTDATTLLKARNDIHGCQQWQVVQQCLDKAMEQELWQEAMAATLLLDRFSYRNRRQKIKDLLETAAKIAARGRVRIPLQMKVRRAGFLRNEGLLFEADHQLDKLITELESQDEQLTENEKTVTMVRCLYIKSEVSYRLGLPKVAAHDVVRAVEMTCTLSDTDPKLMALCIQVLTDSLRSMSVGEYNQLKEVIWFEKEDPYTQAYTLNRHAAHLTCYDAFYFSRHQYYAGRSMLNYCFLRSDPLSQQERKACLIMAVKELKLCLRGQGFIHVLRRDDQIYEYAICFHSLGIALSELGEDNLFHRVNELSKMLFALFNKKEQINQAALIEINNTLKDLDLPNVIEDGDYNEAEIRNHLHDLEERMLTADVYPRLKDRQVVRTTSHLQALLRVVEESSSGLLRVEGEEARHHTSPLVSAPIEWLSGPATMSGMIPVRDSTPTWTSSDLTSVDAGESDNEHARRPARGTSSTDIVNIPEEQSVDVLKFPSEQPTSVESDFHLPLVHRLYRPTVPSCMGVVRLTGESTIVEEAGTKPISDERTLNIGGVHDAIAYQFRVEHNDWIYWRTVVYVGEAVNVDLPGGNRSLVLVRFLYQSDHRTWYVAKYYRRQRSITQYLDDVVKQEVGRHFAMEFCNDLKSDSNSVHIDMLPVLHLQILDEHGVIIEYVNVEQYIEGDYTKITDGRGRVNRKSDHWQILTALSHYAWQKSGWRLLFNDFQGWAHKEMRNRLILTDPGMVTDSQVTSPVANQGNHGFSTFWRCQHLDHQVNKYCKTLHLDDPPSELIPENHQS